MVKLNAHWRIWSSQFDIWVPINEYACSEYEFEWPKQLLHGNLTKLNAHKMNLGAQCGKLTGKTYNNNIGFPGQFHYYRMQFHTNSIQFRLIHVWIDKSSFKIVFGHSYWVKERPISHLRHSIVNDGHWFSSMGIQFHLWQSRVSFRSFNFAHGQPSSLHRHSN